MAKAERGPETIISLRIVALVRYRFSVVEWFAMHEAGVPGPDGRRSSQGGVARRFRLHHEPSSDAGPRSAAAVAGEPVRDWERALLTGSAGTTTPLTMAAVTRQACTSLDGHHPRPTHSRQSRPDGSAGRLSARGSTFATVFAQVMQAESGRLSLTYSPSPRCARVGNAHVQARVAACDQSGACPLRQPRCEALATRRR